MIKSSYDKHKFGKNWIILETTLFLCFMIHCSMLKLNKFLFIFYDLFFRAFAVKLQNKDMRTTQC